MTSPPPPLERLIRSLLGERASTPFVIGDLREEYRAVRSRRPALFAVVWYLVQGLAVAARTSWTRRREGGRAARALSPARGGGLVDGVSTDLRQALRFLLRRPGLSGAVVVTVALAIAATTLAFAVVDGVLLEPLPYRSPDRLVALWERNPGGDERNVVSPANFLAWRDELRSVDAFASLLESSATLVEEGRPERVGFVMASPAWFEMVGAEPVVGRLYGEADDRDGTPSVVVLSEGFWRRRFGADGGVVGRTLNLGNMGTHTVLGVLPERYDFEEIEASFGSIGSHDLWMPPRLPPEAREAGGRYLQVVGRLAAGASLEEAQREASALAARLGETYPDRQRGWGVNVVPLQDDLVGDARSIILVVFGAVCFVLLIACANVANLLMTRALEREQEMAVRSAIGAGRGRILRQLLAESGLLAALGGVGGVLLARQGLSALVGAAPDIPRIASVGLDGTVVAFSLLATAATALLFGLAPALPLTRASASSWLGTRGPAARRDAQHLRAVLVVAQVSLSLVLLVGAGLLVRSLVNRLDAGVGFEVENLLMTDVQLGGGAYPPERQTQFFEQAVERLAGLPGVVEASAVTWPPLAGGGTRTDFWRLDRPLPEPGLNPGADVRWVHRDYHRTLRIPLLAGRTFEESDQGAAPLVVLVNETGARGLWPGESPLGKRIAMPWEDTLVAEVVGVVGDIRHDGPDTPPYPMFYFDHRQFRAFNFMSLMVRSEGVESAAVVAGVREVLASLDAGIAPYRIRSMEELLADAMKRERLATVSLGLFALVALVLAAIGLYGVMAHATQQRAREIGIRLALGADRGSILGMVMGRGVLHLGVATLVGGAGALVLSRLLESLVFEVSTSDPLTFIVMSAVLLATGLAACWLPARRAVAIDPATTMRSE